MLIKTKKGGKTILQHSTQKSNSEKNHLQNNLSMETNPQSKTNHITSNQFQSHIGKTLYTVGVHFSEISNETMQDKILRMIEREGHPTGRNSVDSCIATGLDNRERGIR